MKVAAGIIHYRFWPGVAGTIDAAMSQTRPPDELFVYEHASGDDSAERIRERFPGLEVIEAPENRGPIPGANAVLAELTSRDVDALLVLTQNSRLAPDALEHLAARLEETPEVGAAGPLIGYADDPDRVFFGGGYIDPRTWDIKFNASRPRMSDWDGVPPREVDWLEFAGLLMRKEAVLDTGELFEGYYYHYDDSDYTARIKKHGWRLELVPAARAWKQPGQRSTYLEVRNRLGFVNRTAGRRIMARELVRSLYHLMRNTIRPPQGVSRSFEARSRLLGIVDFLRGRWGAPPKSLRGRGGGRYG